MINYTAKSRIQEEAILSWRESCNRGILAMCTGSGKSKCAIDIIKKDKPKKILLTVPTVKLRDTNWEEEFIKWKAKTLYTKIERSCYISMSKLKNRHYDLVILDEGHNITENNSEFFNNNTVKDILVLTATPPVDSTKKSLLKNIGCEVVFSYSLDQGIRDGVISPYEIRIVEIPLNGKDKNVKAGTKKKPFMTTEYKNYQYLNKQVSNAMYSKYDDALKWAALRRMRFIYNLKSKTDMARKLISTIQNDEKALIFCGSIEQAEELSPYVYHSKSSDKDLIRFEKEEIKQLACVAALNEGVNIKNLDVGIIVQLNSKDLNLVQRIGRLIRYREGHKAIIYILVSQGTQDVKWASKALSGFDQTRIKYIHYNRYD